MKFNEIVLILLLCLEKPLIFLYRYTCIQVTYKLLNTQCLLHILIAQNNQLTLKRIYDVWNIWNHQYIANVSYRYNIPGIYLHVYITYKAKLTFKSTSKILSNICIKIHKTSNNFNAFWTQWTYQQMSSNTRTFFHSFCLI